MLLLYWFELAAGEWAGMMGLEAANGVAVTIYICIEGFQFNMHL